MVFWWLIALAAGVWGWVSQGQNLPSDMPRVFNRQPGPWPGYETNAWPLGQWRVTNVVVAAGGTNVTFDSYEYPNALRTGDRVRIVVTTNSATAGSMIELDQMWARVAATTSNTIRCVLPSVVPPATYSTVTGYLALNLNVLRVTWIGGVMTNGAFSLQTNSGSVWLGNATVRPFQLWPGQYLSMESPNPVPVNYLYFQADTTNDGVTAVTW